MSRNGKKLEFAADKTERRKISDLKPHPKNPKTHPPAQVASVAKMIREFGFTRPLLIDEHDTILAGHGATLAAEEVGLQELPVVVLRGLTDTQKLALLFSDNRSFELGGWDDALRLSGLSELKTLDYSLELVGYDPADLVMFVAQANVVEAERQQNIGSLSDRFGIAPFSVLNAREGWWQDRKRGWLALGIQSELGRGDSASTSARVGPDEPATYRPIGGKKQNASPGGSPRPAADYSNKARGDGAGKPIRRKANAIPGVAPMPLDRAKDARARTKAGG